jgi:sugar lactone lactonase YvrE
MTTAPTVTFLPVHTALGESPVWDAERSALWFVDIEACLLWRMDWPARTLQSWPMPETVASIGLCTSGRLLLAMRHALRLFDPATGSLQHFADVEVDMPGNRLNDGKVAPDGTFWIGSMDEATKSAPTGALYQVAADGSVRRRVGDLVTSNGLAWSADGRHMFHSDSRGRFIKRYRYRGGDLSEETLIAEPSVQQGRPDGGATDVEGGYWSAGVSAGTLNRYTADGRSVERLRLPVAHPTMPCFGGPDLTLLFVTSLVTDSSDASGALLCLDAGVAGVPVARFPL